MNSFINNVNEISIEGKKKDEENKEKDLEKDEKKEREKKNEKENKKEKKNDIYSYRSKTIDNETRINNNNIKIKRKKKVKIKSIINKNLNLIDSNNQEIKKLEEPNKAINTELYTNKEKEVQLANNIKTIKYPKYERKRKD